MLNEKELFMFDTFYAIYTLMLLTKRMIRCVRRWKWMKDKTFSS